MNSKRFTTKAGLSIALIAILSISSLLLVKEIQSPTQTPTTAKGSTLTLSFGVQDNNSGSGRSVPELDILHTRWPWENLLVNTNQTNLTDLKNWVNQNSNAGKKSMIGLLLNNTPGFMKDTGYQPIEGQYTNFANTAVQAQYQFLVQALCNEFCDNPNVIFEVNAGYDGEPRPIDRDRKNIYLNSENWKTWRPNPQQTLEVTLSGGIARDPWMYWLFFITKTWADTVQNQKPIYVVTTQIFEGTIEHTFPFIKHNNQTLNWIDYIKARDLGIKTTGFGFDMGRYWGPDYSWQQTMRSFASEGRPVSCEKGASDINSLSPEVFSLVHDEHFYWAAWAALDMGCNPFLVLHRQGNKLQWEPNVPFETDAETKQSSLQLFRDMYQNAGRPPSQIQKAWIVLRSTELTPAPECSNPAACDTDNFGNGITLREPQGGKTIPEWNDYWSLSAGGQNPPYNPTSQITSLDTQKSKEGRFTRRTDIASGNPRMYFDVHNQFIQEGTSATITIKYFDSGTDNWTLVTKDQNGQDITNKVTKTNSLTWKEASFTIQGGAWNNSFAGSDFYIDAGTSGDEFIHYVFIDKQADIHPPTSPPKPPPPPANTPDLNGDGKVNMFDFELFRGKYIQNDLTIDFSQNGSVGPEDFDIFVQQFGS